MISACEKMGFDYVVEHIRNGELISAEVCQNLVPSEGVSHVLGVLLSGVAQVYPWYIGLYEGNFTPVASTTMLTLPTDAAETIAYEEATRVAFTPGAASNGTVSNTASKAEFTFTANKTVYGGFMTSTSGKSSTTGVLISVVRFTNPKVVTTGDVLRVTAGLTLSNI